MTSPEDQEQRIAELELRVRGLTERVWMLEQTVATDRDAEHAPGAPPIRPTAPPVGVFAKPPATRYTPATPTGVVASPVPQTAPHSASVPTGRTIDLEQRIGARWTTWVGIVAILFAISFFLKWSFENNLIGPEVRVILGLLSGVALLAGGLLLSRHQDLPYLSEGLAGGGLGVLYLSLYAAYAFYGFVGAGAAFASMFGVTVVGAFVAVASSRQITAVLTVVGGLLTPVLLATDRPDERVLLGYLIVLDLLVLSIARFRSWLSLNQLAWAGSAILLLPTLLGRSAPPHPLTRLVLLSGLFLLFLAAPLVREWTERRRAVQIDLALVVANAAGYFWAVYVTLELWRPAAEAPYALALAVLYAVLAAAYEQRVREEDPTADVLLGVAVIFLTLAIPLGLDGPWITLAWAAQGVLLLWLAPLVGTSVAGWGGLAALLLATFRVVAFDTYWYPTIVPVWNLTYLVHLLVVVALTWGGLLAASAPADRLRLLTGEELRTILWVASALVLAALLWREPPRLWPAGLLAAELLALGGLAKAVRAPAFFIATPIVALVLLGRVLVYDDPLARGAAVNLVNGPLLMRIGAGGTLALAARWLTNSTRTASVANVGRALSATAGVVLLYVLSIGWIRYQDVEASAARTAGQGDLVRQTEWRKEIGLSVLWTLYAAAAMAWGFIRALPIVRYAALGLFGLVILKVFLVDLATVSTLYRIVSFLILGVVLLGVSFLYQRVRSAAA